MLEHRRCVKLGHIANSAIAEHAWEDEHPLNWDEVKCIAQDKHWYARRIKEAIQIRLHPDNLNRDSGIDFPEDWMPTIRRHCNSKATPVTTSAASAPAEPNNSATSAPEAASSLSDWSLSDVPTARTDGSLSQYLRGVVL